MPRCTRRAVIAPLIALALLAPAAQALPHHGKPAAAQEKPKPPTYEEAVAQEQTLLDNPIAAMLPAAGMAFDDDALLRVIDQADHEGKADSLPVPVAKRLSAWRQANEREEAYNKAPWQHGPVTVELDGPVALDVPKGYKLLPSAAVAALAQFGAQDGNGKALLASEDDQHLYGIQLIETGHYDPAALTLHPEALKQALDDHYSSPLMPVPQPGEAGTPQALQRLLDHPAWLQEPRYDEQRHILSWSHTQPALPPRTQALRFGRTWTVQIIATGGIGSEALLENARNFAAGVHFHAGQDYADATPGDARATTRIEDVVSGGPNPMQQMVTERMAAGMQEDQDRRDDAFQSMLLRVCGPILGLIAVAVGTANRRKAAAEKDAPPPASGDGQSGDQQA
jgi:hypothetical protein